MKCRGQDGPTALKTIFGWALSGPIESCDQSGVQHAVHLSTTHVVSLCQEYDGSPNWQLRQFWELESLGIMKEEKSVADVFASTIAFKEGRYEVQLAWKEPHPLLPDNYQLSHKRLWNLRERLQREPEVLQEYDSVIKDQLSKGIVEIVGNEDVGELGKVHYIPHHAVIRRDKETTTLRIVYDASSKTFGPSLNN